MIGGKSGGRGGFDPLDDIVSGWKFSFAPQSQSAGFNGGESHCNPVVYTHDQGVSAGALVLHRELIPCSSKHGISSSTARRPGHPSPQKKSKTVKMRRSVVLEDEEDDSGTTESHPDPLKPWFDKYQLDFNVREVVPEGIDTIQWISSHMFQNVDHYKGNRVTRFKM
ncbi:hypothetical protein B0H13DRAFT_1862098 [Mycena leptocephala]|nr:hypothetical protein B0H13DRAFT_1862098 [Mycena leptocephala]